MKLTHPHHGRSCDFGTLLLVIKEYECMVLTGKYKKEIRNLNPNLATKLVCESLDQAPLLYKLIFQDLIQ